MPGRVIVVGSVNIDLVARSDHLPVPGETVTGSTFAEHDGGKGANQAVAAARLGARTAFVGAVGRDPFGLRARATLEREGIEITGLRTVEGPTGVALILVDAHGENLISVASGANAAFAPADVTAGFEKLRPSAGDVVLVGHEIRTGATHEALRQARLAKATAILNPAPAGGLQPETLELADVLTPNDLELTALAGQGSPSVRARRVLGDRAGERAVLVSLGRRGALLVAGRQARAIPAPKVDAVDTTGAGDALNGALAAGLAAGLDLAEASRRAVAAATIAVTRPGARAGMPTAAELDASLAAAARASKRAARS